MEPWVSNNQSDSAADEELFSEDTIAAPSHEKIAALAYQLWIARGSEDGAAEEDWFEAEHELRVANGQRTVS